MDLEKYAKQYLQGEQGQALKKVTESEAGAKILGSVDGEKLEKAAREGDTQALSAMLKQVLSTPEGRSFAAAVQKAVNQDGR